MEEELRAAQLEPYVWWSQEEAGSGGRAPGCTRQCQNGRAVPLGTPTAVPWQELSLRVLWMQSGCAAGPGAVGILHPALLSAHMARMQARRPWAFSICCEGAGLGRGTAILLAQPGAAVLLLQEICSVAQTEPDGLQPKALLTSRLRDQPEFQELQC